MSEVPPHSPRQTLERLQGYLIHTTTTAPLGSSWDSRHEPTAGFYEGAVSYERGTPVARGLKNQAVSFNSRAQRIKTYTALRSCQRPIPACRGGGGHKQVLF
jgi:hypothetical protein